MMLYNKIHKLFGLGNRVIIDLKGSVLEKGVGLKWGCYSSNTGS